MNNDDIPIPASLIACFACLDAGLPEEWGGKVR